MLLVIILLYIIGVFAAYIDLTNRCCDENGYLDESYEILRLLCFLSWIYLISVAIEEVINYIVKKF